LVGRARGADLLKVLDEAHELAAEGAATTPPEVAANPADRSARRQFSFSRLTGKLVRPRIANNENERDAPTAPGSAGGFDDESEFLFTASADVPDADTGFPSSVPSAAPLLDARALGSLTHDVLARIDLSAKGLSTEIADWCEHLAPQYVLENTTETA